MNKEASWLLQDSLWPLFLLNFPIAFFPSAFCLCYFILGSVLFTTWSQETPDLFGYSVKIKVEESYANVVLVVLELPLISLAKMKRNGWAAFSRKCVKS